MAKRMFLGSVETGLVEARLSALGLPGQREQLLDAGEEIAALFGSVPHSINVYNGYLVLHGMRLADGYDLRFVAVDTTNKKASELPVVPVERTGQGWKATIDFQGLSQPHKLYVRSQASDRHVYAKEPMTITFSDTALQSSSTYWARSLCGSWLLWPRGPCSSIGPLSSPRCSRWPPWWASSSR